MCWGKQVMGCRTCSKNNTNSISIPIFFLALLSASVLRPETRRSAFSSPELLSLAVELSLSVSLEPSELLKKEK